ncbi:hypothetical protein DFH09DRAFT_1357947 [Mycena vulgaris]|nr:hypothetical protein DFH09DRAFT_1357947 [Mycena vulgaris]
MLITARNLSPDRPVFQPLADDIPIVLIAGVPSRCYFKPHLKLHGPKSNQNSQDQALSTLPSRSFKCDINFAQAPSLSVPEVWTFSLLIQSLKLQLRNAATG